MSTYNKGKEFEDRVYRIFKDLLERNELPINASKSSMFQRKKYYSKERENDIELDISIETYWKKKEDLEEKENPWSILTMIECKNYSNKIPIDDLEELHRKLQQIAPVNGKAIMVTQNSFSQSAFNYARNNGIALVRILPDDQYKPLMHFSTGNSNNFDVNDFVNALTDEGHVDRNYSIFNLYQNKVYSGIEGMLKDMYN